MKKRILQLITSLNYCIHRKHMHMLKYINELTIYISDKGIKHSPLPYNTWRHSRLNSVRSAEPIWMSSSFRSLRVERRKSMVWFVSTTALSWLFPTMQDCCITASRMRSRSSCWRGREWRRVCWAKLWCRGFCVLTNLPIQILSNIFGSIYWDSQINQDIFH